MDDEQLSLRPTVIAGDRLDNDYQIIWRGMSVGRIQQQPGIPVGRPNWSWGVAFPGQPQPPGHRGLCSDLEECKRRVKVVWSGVRHALTEADIQNGREVVAASNALRKRWAER
jgi:hypothetical protein